jgi:hypothetical protein
MWVETYGVLDISAGIERHWIGKTIAPQREFAQHRSRS